jgi:murein DD-endopeptidase MepM/ murein hydrolase activator NlpD
MHNKIFAILDNGPVASLSPLPPAQRPSPNTPNKAENTPAIAGKVSSLEEASEKTQNYLSSLEPYYNDLLIAYKNKQQHMPQALPLNGPISSPFGNRPDPFNRQVIEFHNGVDIMAPYGTPVKAPADGTVLSAAYESSWGYRITIDHGYSVTTFYAHLSRMDARPGQEVKGGAVIGRTGNSGRSTGTHLHYSILVNGQAVDPMRFPQEPLRSPQS